MVNRMQSDRGAIEGFVMLTLLALTGFAVMLAVVASVFISHERARTAADFAALAATRTQSCSAAAGAATRNGAELRSCTVDAAEARVTVALPSPFGRLLRAAGAPERYLASAHARF